MSAFISYSSRDRDLVIRLAEDLRQKIEHGITEYKYFVIVLSKASIASGWVEKELNAAYMKEVNSRQIVILPAKIEDCEIPALISSKKWADFTTSYDLGLRQLLDVLAPIQITIPKKPSASILIVDDDLSFARVVGESLERLGLSVCETYDPSAGLELARRYQPDTLIVDAWYAVNGDFSHEVAGAFRDLCPGLRIIGLSAMLDTPRTQQACEVFDVLLHKPVTFDDLMEALGLERRRRIGGAQQSLLANSEDAAAEG
jgi:CheY-like chemotaxis protein